MARSNGPFGPAGARPPARRHPADDPFAAPLGAQSNGHWPPPQYPDPAQAGQQGYHFPPEPDPNFGYNQQPAPHQNGQAYQNGQQQQDPYAAQQWGQQQDPRAYDLGNYAPASSQAYPPMDPPPFQHGGAHDPYSQQGYAEGEYDDEFAEEDEPGRGRRWVFIVAALVGAIGVGGALAYTYKSFVAPSGRVPLVKADPNIRPRPDTRAAPGNDKRQQGRLGEDSARPQETAATTDTQDDRAGDESGGPRRVRTIPITPGGGPPPGVQVVPPAAAATSPPAVPGIMLENMGPRPQPPPQRAAPPQQPPQRVTIGTPPPPPQAEEAPEPPVRKAAPIVRAPAPPPPKHREASHKEAPATRPAASPGSGYVAVLSSQRTRMDALKVFADLQQKYSDALSSKVPDVQEANLGEKGIWYRVVVGPPGSRDAANGVCSQLKTAGYSNCWVNSY